VNALKRHGNETTVADIITLTGLPEYQVQETIKHVVNEYDGHMNGVRIRRTPLLLSQRDEEHGTGFYPHNEAHREKNSLRL
jgi:hypothetical protein